MPVPVGRMDTAYCLPVSVGRKDTARSMPMSLGRMDTAHCLPVSVGRKDTARSMPISLGRKDTARSMPVPVGRKDTAHCLPVSVRKDTLPDGFFTEIAVREAQGKRVVDLCCPSSGTLATSFAPITASALLPCAPDRPALEGVAEV